MTETLRLATRGSDLALRQAATVREALSGRRRDVEVREVETRGDQIPDELIHRLGKTGAFVRALDEEVMDGDADLAVHSLKDVPTEDADDLVVAAVPERAAAGDVLVTPDGTALEDLPPGSTVGTASLRRTAQILAARPDLEVEPVRGNVDTRIEKLLAPGLQAEHEERLIASDDDRVVEEGTDEEEGDDEDAEDEFEMSVDEWFDSLSDLERSAMEREVDVEYDALVLAEAGLRRSDLFYDLETQQLPREEFVPAAGQGAIAVTASDPDVVETVRRALDHPRTRVETTVERTILSELGGGCVAPIGIHAMVQGQYVHTSVRVLSQDGTEEVADTRDLDAERYASEAKSFAADLADRGAKELIQEARREEDEEIEDVAVATDDDE
ncbi:hydroxymethylbilane synthase [Haloparvum sp. AD34]